MFPLRCQGPQVGRWVESFPEQMALLVCYLCIGQLNVNSRLGFPVTSAREKQYPDTDPYSEANCQAKMLRCQISWTHSRCR